MRKIFNDENLQAPFMRKGFVQVPMLSAEEVAFIKSRIADLRPADKFAPTGRDGFEYKYHCSFLDKSIEYKREAFALMESVFLPHIQKYLNGYQIISCNFYVKPPGTGEFVIHQNWPMIPDLNDTTVTIWCPLGDVVASNGALQFVQGSHKILPHVEGPMCPGFFDSFRKELIQNHLTPNEMKAGEAMIFDDGLIHWSANNDSDTARIAIQIALAPAEVQPVFFFFDPKHPERFELVEADREFYLASDVIDLTRRQPHWKHVGFVKNENRYIDEKEFIELLARSSEIRDKVYHSTEPAPMPIKVTLEHEYPNLMDRGYTIEPFLDASDIAALVKLHAETTPSVPADYYVSAFGTDKETRRRIFEGITAIVEQKFKRLVPGYRIVMASFVTKKANGTKGQLPIHQDYSFVDHSKHLSLNIWAPLIDTDQRNGCLRNIDYSQRFNHISSGSPQPAPYDSVRPELTANYLTDTPMKAGSACLFDTRVLHATEINTTDTDRTAVFLNLVKEDVTPQLYLYNPEHKGKLEVYEIDSEFLLGMKPNTYPDEAGKEGAKFIGLVDYAPTPWTAAELEARIPRPQESAPKREPVRAAAGQANGSSSVPVGFWAHVRSSLPKIFSSHSQK